MYTRSPLIKSARFTVMLSCQMEAGEMVPLLIAAGGGGNAYLEDPESSLDHIPLEQYENSTIAPSTNGQTGTAGTVPVLMALNLTLGSCHVDIFSSVCQGFEMTPSTLTG